jgi:UDP-N-acetylglucosamine/UDP-N-acetylgalactosamine diphosphorylase
VAAEAAVGTEGPATVRGAALGPRARVASGYVEGAVLLRDASLGACAHVRPGTLLEEQASTGHCVGLKQTVLLSFVTLGSLINFCDVLMSGGTSRRDHSEVGSGFIHFNFTPWGKSGDKATPSLVGDVTGGVFLDRARIFLGGSSGLVGPRRVGFGSISGAGQVVRRDVPEDHLVLESAPAVSKPMRGQPARRLQPIVAANADYIGQLAALRAWYREVRAARTPAGPDGEPTRVLVQAAVEVLEAGLAERWKRLAALLSETGRSVEAPELELPARCPLSFDDRERDHVEWVQGLGDESLEAARGWLEGIADEVAARVKAACAG